MACAVGHPRSASCCRSSAPSPTPSASASGMLVMVPVFLDRRAAPVHVRGDVIDRDITQVWHAGRGAGRGAARAPAGRGEAAARPRPRACLRQACRCCFDVDLEVDEGEIVALLGTNGAGKSTLLKAISGVVEADHGAVVFDGRDITHAPPERDRGAAASLRCPGGAACSRRSPSPRTCASPAGCTARTATPGRASRCQVLELFPVLRSGSTSPRPTCRAGSSRCSRWAWRSSPEPRLLMIDELVARSRAGRRRAAAAARRGDPRRRDDGHPRRAVGEPRADDRARPRTSWRRARSGSTARPRSCSSGPTCCGRCSSRGGREARRRRTDGDAVRRHGDARPAVRRRPATAEPPRRTGRGRDADEPRRRSRCPA